MPRLLTTLCLTLTVASLATASSLEQLQTSFMKRYDEANAERDQNLRKLEASYLGALQRHMDKVKASGKLERVIPVRDEIEAIETGADPLPELPERADRDLGKMREKYAEARDRIRRSHAETLIGLSEKMNEALEAEEFKLTKAGKIDDALAAKRMRETLAKDEGITLARKIVNSGGRAPVVTGKWRSLLDEKMELLSANHKDVGVLSRISAEHVYDQQLRERREKPDAILVAHPPAKFQFQLGSRVTSLKGKCHLGGSGGKAAFKVWSGDKLVFEKTVSAPTKDQAFEVEFAPSRELTLEIDSLGEPNHDWCSWIEPEVR